MTIPFWWSFGMMNLGTLVFSVLAWYLGQILPGEYGIKRAWHFPCTAALQQGGGGSGGGGDLLSPTAQQLHQVNQFFKGGHITRQQKDELKMSILEASTDSL